MNCETLRSLIDVLYDALRYALKTVIYQATGFNPFPWETEWWLIFWNSIFKKPGRGHRNRVLGLVDENVICIDKEITKLFTPAESKMAILYRLCTNSSCWGLTAPSQEPHVEKRHRILCIWMLCTKNDWYSILNK